MTRNTKELAAIAACWLVAFWMAPTWFLPVAWSLSGAGLYLLGRRHGDHWRRARLRGSLRAALKEICTQRIHIHEREKSEGAERPWN